MMLLAAGYGAAGGWQIVSSWLLGVIWRQLVAVLSQVFVRLLLGVCYVTQVGC